MRLALKPLSDGSGSRWPLQVVGRIRPVEGLTRAKAKLPEQEEFSGPSERCPTWTLGSPRLGLLSTLHSQPL